MAEPGALSGKPCARPFAFRKAGDRQPILRDLFLQQTGDTDIHIFRRPPFTPRTTPGRVSPLSRNWSLLPPTRATPWHATSCNKPPPPSRPSPTSCAKSSLPPLTPSTSRTWAASLPTFCPRARRISPSSGGTGPVPSAIEPSLRPGARCATGSHPPGTVHVKLPRCLFRARRPLSAARREPRTPTSAPSHASLAMALNSRRSHRAPMPRRSHEPPIGPVSLRRETSRASQAIAIRS